MASVTSAPAERRLARMQSITSRGDGGSAAGRNRQGWRAGEGMEAELEGTQAWLTWIGVTPIIFK